MVWSSLAQRMLVIATLAPALANAITVARPIPCAPPVTIATRPSRLSITLTNSHLIGLPRIRFDAAKRGIITHFGAPDVIEYHWAGAKWAVTSFSVAESS